MDQQFEGGAASSSRPTFTDDGSGPGAQVQETLAATRQQLVDWASDSNRQHPLLQVQALAAMDRLDPAAAAVEDHGSWDGRWQLPSPTQWTAKEAMRQTWPCGRAEYEAQAVQATRKELTWSKITPFEKSEFKQACADGWKVWVDNDAIQILSKDQSMKVVEQLQAKKQTTKLLTPRWVMTDKNDSMRTKHRSLPLRANSRLVVPGYQDVSSYGLRKDAPTGSRLSQHILYTLVSSYFKEGWRMCSADIKSAFMKGESYVEGSGREIYLQNVSGPSDYPKLPIPEGCIARILKGVFGLSDAPRMWYLRLHRALQERGWQRNPLDHASSRKSWRTTWNGHFTC